MSKLLSGYLKLFSFFLLKSAIFSQVVNSQQVDCIDCFCGTNWVDANDNCYGPCPKRTDAECKYLGEDFACHEFTACERVVPTGSPILPAPTKSPAVTERPTLTPTTAAPVTGESAVMSRSPTTYDTTTLAPSGAPVIPIKANMITILRNVPERYLTLRESEKFLELALTFLRKNTEDSMVIEGLELYHLKLITMSCDEVTTQVPSSEKQAKDIDATEQEGTTNMKSLQNESNNDEDLAFGYYYDDEDFYYDEEEEECQVMGMEVTLIAKVSSASLPHNLLGSTAAAAFEEQEEEFLNQLHEHDAFYTFFKGINGISAVGVDELTPPPTESPTTYAYYLGNEQYEYDWEPIFVVEEESTSMPTPNPPSNTDKVTNEGNVEKTTPSPTPGPTLGPSSDATTYSYSCQLSALSFIIAFLW